MSRYGVDERTIEISGGLVVVRSHYDDDVVRAMRDLGLARYWDADDRAYNVPENYFLEPARRKLVEDLGFFVT